MSLDLPLLSYSSSSCHTTWCPFPAPIPSFPHPAPEWWWPQMLDGVLMFSFTWVMRFVLCFSISLSVSFSLWTVMVAICHLHRRVFLLFLSKWNTENTHTSQSVMYTRTIVSAVGFCSFRNTKVVCGAFCYVVCPIMQHLFVMETVSVMPMITHPHTATFTLRHSRTPLYPLQQCSVTLHRLRASLLMGSELPSKSQGPSSVHCSLHTEHRMIVKVLFTWQNSSFGIYCTITQHIWQSCILMCYDMDDCIFI